MSRQDTFMRQAGENRAVIKFETTTLNLGEISFGSEGSCWFIFENTGKSPLVITSVMTTCDCAASSWPGKPVYPGKKDSIGVIYNTHNPGFFSKTLEVHSNAENSPTVLTIKGKVQQQ
jgi:hypothetical protein